MQVEIDFNFIAAREDDDLDNNSQNIIRHCVVEMMRDSGYGEIVNDDEFILTNTFIRPFVMGFVGAGQHELLYGYVLPLTNDTRHGNLASLLIQGISNLYINMNNQAPNVRVFVRTTYLND